MPSAEDAPIIDMANASLEGHKLDHDTYKHLTTLSTGSILLLATFLEKLFQKPSWKFLVSVALVSFITSVVASVSAMFLISLNIHVLVASSVMRGESYLGLARYIALTSIVVTTLACGGFIVGIAALAIFAIKNLGPSATTSRSLRCHDLAVSVIGQPDRRKEQWRPKGPYETRRSEPVADALSVTRRS